MHGENMKLGLLLFNFCKVMPDDNSLNRNV